MESGLQDYLDARLDRHQYGDARRRARSRGSRTRSTLEALMKRVAFFPKRHHQ
jgi:hypothetical protein